MCWIWPRVWSLSTTVLVIGSLVGTRPTTSARNVWSPTASLLSGSPRSASRPSAAGRSGACVTVTDGQAGATGGSIDGRLNHRKVLGCSTPDSAFGRIAEAPTPTRRDRLDSSRATRRRVFSRRVQSALGTGGMAGAASASEDEAHRLGAGGRVAQLTAHRAGQGLRTGLANSPHGHAQVFGFDDDDDPRRLQQAAQRVGNLGRQPLLYLWALGVHVDEPRQLGQAGDAPVGTGDVAHVRVTVERHQVVFARRGHFDVLHQDQLVVAELEGRRQDLGRILAQPPEHLLVGTGEPGRRVAESFARRILTDGDEQLPDRRLDANVVERLRGDAREIGLGDHHGHVRSERSAACGTAGSSTGTCPPARTPPLEGAASIAFAGVSMGPPSDGLRVAEPVHAGRRSGLRTGAKTSATSSLLSVSRSSRARTRPSRMSRFSTRMSNASWCAVSMSLRTSSSTWPAMSSE